MTQVIQQPKTILNTLKQFDVFRGFAHADLLQVAAFSSLHHYSKEEAIFAESDAIQYFYLIVSGRVQIYKLSPKGQMVIFHIFESNDTIAEVPFWGGHPGYPANAMSLDDDTTLLAVDGKQFKTLCTKNPEILFKLLEVSSQRIMRFTQQVEDLALRNVDARLAKYLLSMPDSKDHEKTFAVQKKTLAAVLGTLPETLSRSFKRLSEQNVIAVDGKTIRILDDTALEDWAAGNCSG